MIIGMSQISENEAAQLNECLLDEMDVLGGRARIRGHLYLLGRRMADGALVSHRLPDNASHAECKAFTEARMITLRGQ